METSSPEKGRLRETLRRVTKTVHEGVQNVFRPPMTSEEFYRIQQFSQGKGVTIEDLQKEMHSMTNDEMMDFARQNIEPGNIGLLRSPSPEEQERHQVKLEHLQSLRPTDPEVMQSLMERNNKKLEVEMKRRKG